MEPRFDFDERPFVVIWETTQACDLACVHCRACAQPLRSSLELSTDDAKRLINEVAALDRQGVSSCPRSAADLPEFAEEPCCVWPT